MKNIIIYSTPSCVYCRKAKTFFGEKNIAYKEVNVEGDPQAQQEMVAKSHQFGVPVIDIEGDIYVGFDRDVIAQALGVA